MKPKTVYVSLGSNMGERLENLRATVRALGQTRGTEVAKVSPVYETVPVGYSDQSNFLNAAAKLDVSGWTAVEFVGAVKRIEARLGRVPGPRWGPRTIDIDVISFGSDRTDVGGEFPVTIPHPRASERPFVLVPIADIDPNAMIGDNSASNLLEKLGGAPRTGSLPSGLQRWALPTGDERIWER